MNVYIPYKKTPSAELYWSIKSLKNIKHDKIIVIGDTPDLELDIQVINNILKPQWALYSPYNDVINKLRIVAELEPNDFIFSNDDIFILKKWTPEVYQQGTIQKHIDSRKADSYILGLQKTLDYLNLQGLPTLDYELHTPFIFNPEKLKATIKEIEPILDNGVSLMIRTIYGNKYHQDAKYHEDVKNKKRDDIISTDESTFLTDLGEYIRDKI